MERSPRPAPGPDAAGGRTAAVRPWAAIRHGVAVRYGAAFASVAVALLLKILLATQAEVTSPFLLFLGAALFSSWFGGIGPGLLATLLAALAADYFFLTPLYQFGGYTPEQAYRLLQFVGEGCFISVLSGLRRHYSLQAHRRFEELHVTLRSIADAVIATDARGAVDFLNPVAAALIGRPEADAVGRPLTEVLRLIDEGTRAPVEPPTRGVIATGGPVTLPGRTLLVAGNGATLPVSGSAAPIRGVGGELLGAVLVLRDVTEQRLADELMHSRLLSRLATIQEDERRRIARELHDQTGQELAALTLGLKALSERPEAAGAVADALRSLQGLAEGLGRSAHQLASELRPAALDDLGLETALRHSVEQWSGRTGMPADIHCALGPGRLPPEVETHVYRIVLEALANVGKHAAATRVSVILQRRPGHLLAIIEDNGRGFDLAAVRAATGAGHKLGLFGMRERAALVGGTLNVESAPGRGTTVFVRMPLAGEGEKRP
jgi:PAS domain S-box-containing protein